MKPSEAIDRKFIESFNVDDYEVLTDSGWVDIKSSNKTIEYDIWKIKTTSHELMCADTHIVFDENMEEVFVKDLKVKSKIQTESGLEEVISIENLNTSDNMYDIELSDDSNHRYFTNGILSHNSTLYCIYSMWLSCFYPEKKVLILANKLATALELLGKITMAYEYLPDWIKPAVLTFNKGQIAFANKSEIRCFASSSDAARGFTANCLTGDAIVTIQDCNKKIHKVRIDKVNDIIKFSKENKVLTENGFKKFFGVKVSKASKIIDIELNTGEILSCTPEHKIKIKTNKFIKAEKLYNGCELSTGVKIVSINYRNIENELVYDLIEVEDGHEYIANGITVHNCVILDEFAFLQKNIADKLFTSMYPVISSSKNSKMIIVSTPNGIGNLFYEIWKKANSKDQNANDEGWKPFIMWWWQVPGHDEEWKEKTIASIGKERFAQEFNNEFLAGSSFSKLIGDDIIDKFRRRNEEFKIKREHRPKTLTVPLQMGTKAYDFLMWEAFDPKHTYVAAGDISEGVGGDFSVLYIFDITDLSRITLCARFWNNTISPMEFAYVTVKILALYGNPYYICESNAVGSAYLETMRITYKYYNIVKEGKDGAPGVRSHVQTKGRACLWLKDMFTTPGFDWIIPDPDLIEELSNFIKKDVKIHISYAAMQGAHDDLVAALMWAAYVLQPDIIEKYYIVTETFTTELEQIMPLRVEPLDSYSNAVIHNIQTDPLYQQFMYMHDEFSAMSMKAKKLEIIDDNRDDFFNPVAIGSVTASEMRQRLLDNQRHFDTRRKSFYILGSSSDFDDDGLFDGPTW